MAGPRLAWWPLSPGLEGLGPQGLSGWNRSLCSVMGRPGAAGGAVCGPASQDLLDQGGG